MDSSISRKEEIWFLRVWHHISIAVYSTVLWLPELQIRLGWKVETQVHSVNSNSRTSNRPCKLFWKKNPVIRIFCISGWFVVPINPDKCSSAVYTVTNCTFQWYQPANSFLNTYTSKRWIFAAGTSKVRVVAIFVIVYRQALFYV
jgi:hypothetical protein